VSAWLGKINVKLGGRKLALDMLRLMLSMVVRHELLGSKINVKIFIFEMSTSHVMINVKLGKRNER